MEMGKRMKIFGRIGTAYTPPPPHLFIIAIRLHRVTQSYTGYIFEELSINI